MKVPGLRSPNETVGGLVHFGRMLDKIRLHAKGALPRDYLENLGKGFDDRCCRFLNINYAELVERVKKGGTDEDILQACFDRGRKPSAEDIEVWNEFMRKRGWRDSSSDRLAERLKEAGIARRTDIQTFFELIELDESH